MIHKIKFLNTKKFQECIIGFPCITKIDPEKHFSGADIRIFLLTKYGHATIMYFSKTNKCTCKNVKVRNLIAKRYLQC